jgi:hypothetical protein
MRCRFVGSDQVHKTGRTVVVCNRDRCGKIGLLPRSGKPGDLDAECSGTPDASEWREWLALFATALGVNKAAATVAYARWRAKGSPIDELPPNVPRPGLQPPAEGPGTELKKILDALGIEPTNGCQCAARQAEMNIRGVEGCNRTRAELLGWLKEGYDESALTEKVAALAMALSKGLPLTIEGVLDEAIRRATATARGS